MNVWKRIKKFNLGQLYELAKLFILKPHYISLTIRASRQAMYIASQHYGRLHHKDTKANAFRHALWNILLGKSVYERTDDINKAKSWAKKVTDLHEQLAPNEALARAMDLHNNKIGRIWLEQNIALDTSKHIEQLKALSQKAIKVTSLLEIKNETENLVYIIDL